MYKTRKSVSLSYDYIYWGLRYIEMISNNYLLLSNNIGLIALAISFHASITAVYLSWVNLEVEFFRGRFLEDCERNLELEPTIRYLL